MEAGHLRNDPAAQNPLSMVELAPRLLTPMFLVRALGGDWQGPEKVSAR